MQVVTACLSRDVLKARILPITLVTMKLLSINVGKPVKVEFEGKTVTTGIFKSRVEGKRLVKTMNIEGDGQADLKVHGGRDKAVYAYGYDAYPWWEKELGQSPLPHASFGENLVFSTLDEKQTFLGDIFELGTCQLLAIQPRMPCFKLGVKFGDMGIVKTFMESGRPGVYFRVEKEGEIEAGQSLKLIHREPVLFSISEMYEYYLSRKMSPQRAREVVKNPLLLESWRKKIETLLSPL
jgi:MOSC domain-containing protein YiiM